MKRFIIIGAISVGVAVSVLLACASAPTAKHPRKYFVIKVDLATGIVDWAGDEHNTPAEHVPAWKLEQIERTGGFRHVSTILYTHSSPGCGFVNWGGTLVYICP